MNVPNDYRPKVRGTTQVSRANFRASAPIFVKKRGRWHAWQTAGAKQWKRGVRRKPTATRIAQCRMARES